MKKLWFLACLIVFCAGIVTDVFAEEFDCEVMSVQGTAVMKNDKVDSKLLKEGDVLKSGDWVEVASASYVDIAYDSDWNNVTRIEENSKIQIRSVYPSSLMLTKGSVFAKLKSLPRDTSFEVQTPTAVAAVRGTEFKTEVGESGSQVYNFSDSNVYVYGLDESGEMSKTHEPLILKNTEKTQVEKRGEFRFQSRPMTLGDQVHGKRTQENMETRAGQVRKEGRVGKIQDLKKVNAEISDRIKKGDFKKPEDRFPGMKPRTQDKPQRDFTPGQKPDGNMDHDPNGNQPHKRDGNPDGSKQGDMDKGPRRDPGSVNGQRQGDPNNVKSPNGENKNQPQKRATPPPRPRPRQ